MIIAPGPRRPRPGEQIMYRDKQPRLSGHGPRARRGLRVQCQTVTTAMNGRDTMPDWDRDPRRHHNVPRNATVTVTEIMPVPYRSNAGVWRPRAVLLIRRLLWKPSARKVCPTPPRHTESRCG